MSRYDIAIIGMGGIFPKANSVEQYWKNIVSGESFFSKMPEHLWHLDNFYSPEKNIPEKTYTTVGSFIEGFEFPFLEYKLPPKALQGVDPAQLVTLEATKEALLDAGIEPRASILEDGITVIGGSGVDAFAHSSTFLRRHAFFKKLRQILESNQVPKATIESLEQQYGQDLQQRGHAWNPSIAAVGAIISSVSNRVAQVFGIKGFNLTVDGACASSFTALDTACHALMAGDAKVAVAGGVDLGTNPAIYIGFSRVEGLSATGMANPFDHNADGLVIGEGAGVVVLKRLEDAIANGDNIRAVIRGIGSSSDGAGQAIYAPSVEGRAEALENALKKSETDPDEVQFVEAHATSTIVGDANEYDAISTVYGPSRQTTNPLYLGSVKGQIGHLKAAAGMAGLIKTALGMEHKTIPHMPNFTKLTPGATKPNAALTVNSKLLPWETHENGLRVGAITSSGFGGVNYHVILEQGDSYSPPQPRPVVPRDIAIVGVSCRVAGAESVEQFWDNVTEGKDVFTEVDPVELGWEHHLETGPENEKITTHKVSRIGKSSLNLLRHKIFPTAVSQISPTQLLGLELSDRLLQSAGMALEEPKNIGVSVGSMHDDNFPHIFEPMCSDEYAGSIRNSAASKGIDPKVLEEALQVVIAQTREECPPVTEHTLPGWMANVTAGRMANKLNLHGPNFTVDCACSSGLAALVPAMYQLMYGDVDMMISGGLNQQLSDVYTTGVCRIGAISDNCARPFDADGNGFLIGEGGILYLLKRLDKAQADGDEIFAVIHSVSGSSEADSKSMIAPTEKAVQLSIRRTLEKSSKPASAIGVVDAHGSANLLSDLVEARSLAAELRPEETDNPVQITAIKSHTGHLYGGSGAASMLSTIMSLRTRTVPGIRNLSTPRPEIENLKGRVQPRHGTEKLPEATTAGGINSLGLGGANYFAVVSVPGEENNMNIANGGNNNMKPAPTVSTSKPSMRADDEISAGIFVCLAESLDELTAALGRAAQQSPIPQFISEGNATASRLAVTYQSQEELETKINSALRMLGGGHDLRPLESQGIYYSEVDPNTAIDKLAFCFPGQGTHYISMGQQLYAENEIFRSVLDQVHSLAMKTFKFDLLGHIHGDIDDKEIAKNLGTLVGAQTALFAVEVGMAKVLESMELLPSVMIGHSFGEISALTFAGVWDIETAYKVVEARIKAAEQIIKGGGPKLGMMSVICSDDQRDALLKVSAGKAVLTNINAPGRFVFAGELDAVKQTVEIAESFGAEARILPIGAAFHSHFMEPAREPFRKALAKLPCENPRFPILSTITGEYIDMQGLTSKKLADHLSGQLITSLNLPREINRLHSEGVQHFLEVGPGWSMTKMINAILEGKDQRSAPTLHPKVGDVETFRRARAFLMALGHLGSAAERQNLPGMFSVDFLDYMQAHEPAVVGLLSEVHKRYLHQVTHVSMTAAGASSEQAPVAPTAVATAAAPAPASAVDIKVWIERVREKLVQTTGYPAEMLEENLDLEADLGVDSVQRAEIWLALTGEHNLDSEARPVSIKTISQLAEALGSMAGGAATAADAATPATAPVAAAATGADIATWVERVREKLVQTTGYPAEMLEENLDLEADLGVDSVQRAEIWLALTGEYNLDSEARPAGVRTISQLAESFAQLEGPVAAPPATPTVVAAPAEAATKAPAAKAPSPAVSSAADIGVWIERVREKLVQTTGYPAEMLEENLDLEADLGVDSVQRAEIWLALTGEHGLNSEARPGGVRTIAQLAESLSALATPTEIIEVAENPSQAAAPALAVVSTNDADQCRLFAASSDLISEDYLEQFESNDALLILGDDDGFESGLVKRLTKKKISHSSITSDALLAASDAEIDKMVSGADTIFYLGHHAVLDASTDDSKLDKLVKKESTRIFNVFKKLGPALASHPTRIVTPVSQDGTFGASSGNAENILGSFPAGFMRSLGRELPDCRFQVLDTGEKPWDESLGDHADKAWPGIEMGLTQTGRAIPTLGRLAPTIDHRPIMNSGDLVIVTGGARGIVFECVAALAQRTGCKLLLTGRTQMPSGKPKWLSAKPSEIDKVIRELEISLVREKGIALGEAKREGARSRSAWELNRNLERLSAMGIQASYEVCDVSSVAEVKKLVKRVAKTETIHGIVHGAGIQQAKLIGDLSEKAIAGVLDTKLNPMFAFLETIDWSEIKLLSGFGSVTGVFGNAGQTDYALGNDLMSWMIQSIKDEHPHIHAQTIAWTAWTGTGMVSEEETKRFVQAGLVPLDIESGVTLFLEGITGSSLPQLSAFNGSASFASGRGLSKFPVAPRPKAKLVEGQQLIRFSVDEDLYLDQHLVQNEPVVPGTFITELFNETSSSKGLVPSEIRFRRPLTVRDNELEVEAVQSGEAITLLPAQRPELNEQALANLAFATCRLSKPTKGEAAKLNYTKTILKKLKAASFNGGAPFYSVLDNRFSHVLKSGPIFRGIRATLEENEKFYGLVTITDEAAALLEMPGEFIWNPVLADMAVQVAAAWSILRNDTMAIPASIGNIHVAGKSTARQSVVICQAHSLTPNETMVDVAVRDLDGKLILAMDKLVLRTIPG